MEDGSGGDDWIAMDKFLHLAICFLIAMFSALTVRRSRIKTVRNWATGFGCIVGLAAGAAKELADEMGIWPSAGGSIKDGVADIGGVLLAALVLHLWKLRAVPVEEGFELQGSMAV